MGKEKSTTELRDEKRTLKAEADGLTGKARGENRGLTAEETERLNAIHLRMQEINVEIASRGEEKPARNEPQRNERFSIRRAIVAAMNKESFGDAEARMFEEGEKIGRGVNESTGGIVFPLETRAAFTAATEAATGVVIDTDQMEMLLPLQPNLVLSAAGTRMLTGLRGNIVWPNYSGSTVAWADENAAAADGAGTIGKGTVYTPKRLTAYVDFSKQLLVQENMSVEALIRQTLAVAIAQKIESTAFGNHAHATNTPDGFFTGVTPTVVALDWAAVVKMETDIDANNALLGNLAYIFHPTLIGKMKTTVKDASGAGGFIFGDGVTGTVNGYKALRSNNMPKGLGTAKDGAAVIFGNFADFFLGQWGAVDLIVDPYTQANKAMVRLVVNSYWDMGVVRAESFVKSAYK